MEKVMPKITEVAPPGKKAEEWITSNKARFKKQYGDNWEPVLYATAWKMFGKKKKVNEGKVKPDFLDLDKDGDTKEPMKKAAMDKKKKITEHKDPSEYVNKWKKLGFDIDVEDLPNDGKKFKISNKGIETVITEPETGIYKTTDDKKFKSFDDAVDHLLKNTFVDINVTESVDYLKRMAGIPKSEKKNLNESFSPIADTIVFKEPNDLSIMAQKLNNIVHSETKPKTIEDHAGISEEDDMTIRELKIACYTSGKILEMMAQGKSPERWNLSKITLAADYLTTVYTFMSSLDGNEPQYESLTESQLNEIFNRRLSAEEEKVANDIYNMAKSTARMGRDITPITNPDFLHYIKKLSDYTKYKDIISKSWKKGYAEGRR
jgi:hypothetical protein